MNPSRSVRDRLRWHWTPAALLGLAALLALSLNFNLESIRRHNEEIAVEGVRNIFRLVVVTRQWNADHGGVYVPITETTPPNVYLDHPRRDVETRDGQHLTMVNPAYMTRQIAELAAQSGSPLIHITSLNPIRPKNRADDWESLALKRFEGGQREVFEVVRQDKRDVLRYMAPLIVSRSCLTCHEAQGYRVGDVRGGISVSINHAPIAQVLANEARRMTILHLVSFGLLGGLIVLLLEMLGRRWAALEKTLGDLEQTRDQLVRSEGTASLGRLMAGFAHEIRRPVDDALKALNQIELATQQLGTLVTARQQAADPLLPPLTRVVEQQHLARGNLRRGLELIDHFGRTASNRGNKDQRNFLLGETIADVLATLHYTLSSRPLDVTVVCPPTLLAFGSPGLYEQAMTSLILSRIGSGFADPAREGHFLIEATASADGSRLGLRISDDGKGITPARLPALFDPTPGFDDAGPGIGLYLAHTVITRELGGSIRCDSDTDKGTHFFIECPLRTASKQADENSPTS